MRACSTGPITPAGWPGDEQPGHDGVRARTARCSLTKNSSAQSVGPDVAGWSEEIVNNHLAMQQHTKRWKQAQTHHDAGPRGIGGNSEDDVLPDPTVVEPSMELFRPESQAGWAIGLSGHSCALTSRNIWKPELASEIFVGYASAMMLVAGLPAISLAIVFLPGLMQTTGETIGSCDHPKEVTV